ncbi:MAG: hypothetical protein ABW043_16860 [Devosia sp.]|uniref:hypothetical protein n=1 Tax=Devosia sp. TaxID=1871048 RepID=UPI0033923CDD
MTAELTTTRDALRKCRDQFAFYADEHTKAGKQEKAATNAGFRDLCDVALTAAEERAGENVDGVAFGESFTWPSLYDWVRHTEEERAVIIRKWQRFRDRQPAIAEERAGEVEKELRAKIINTPETADFMAGVPIEAAHQRERWGVDHDAGKTPFDWFWLIGYLAQKAADAACRGDIEKAKHHTISTAAALANWHAALTGKDNRFQPGITPKPAEMVV